MALEHKLAAILFCDIVGYTATTQRDESEAARQIEEHRKTLQRLVAKHTGNVLQYYGDGSLTIFPSVVDAVDCALELQEQLAEVEVPIRAGIHLGEIYFRQDQFIGDGINIASRIQSEAETGQLLVSQTVSDLIRNKSHLHIEHVGQRNLKNVNGSMSLYSVRRCDRAAGISAYKPSKKSILSFVSWKWAVLLALALAIAFFGVKYAPMPWTDDGSIAKMAVFPFRSLSDEVEDKYLSMGISDDIRSTLARIGGFEVRSRSSSETVHEQNLSAREIGTKLNIDYLLEGSFRRESERLHINLALIDVNSDRTIVPIELSADSPEELLSLMDDIIHKVVRAVNPGESKRQPATGLQTESYKAYKFYLLGRSYLLRTPTVADLEKSEEYFRKAILEDPSFGRAYAGLAEVYLTPAAWGYADMREGIERSRPLANKALQLAPDDAETQYILGVIAEFELNFDVAEQYMRRCIELDPSNALGYLRLARLDIVREDWDGALEYARLATQLDPVSALIASLEPVVLIRVGDSEGAIRTCRKALDQFPGDNNLKFHLGEALATQGLYSEAIEVLLSRTVSTADVNFMLGYAYAKDGQREKAMEVLDYLLEKHQKGYVPPGMIALVYYGLGDEINTHTWMAQESNYFLLMFGPSRSLWSNPAFSDVYSFLGSGRNL